MPDIGVPELLIVMVIIVVLFGPGRLPELGGALGRGIREFRSATREAGTTEPESDNHDAPLSSSQTDELKAGPARH